MANLILLNKCNLSCPFCFADQYMHNDGRNVRMSVGSFAKFAAFSGNTARFCGGEPTIHPDFLCMLEVTLARQGNTAFIMSNGLWPAVVREYFRALSLTDSLRVSFLFNILPDNLYSNDQRKILDETLSLVNPEMVSLGFTIYNTAYEWRHVVERARQHGFRRLRYSLAAPDGVFGNKGTLIEPERDFPLLAPRVYEFVMTARREGFEVRADCVYIPPCYFTDEQLANLLTDQVGGQDTRNLSFSCRSAVDISADGSAWRCFGLYDTITGHTSGFESAKQLARNFDQKTTLLERYKLRSQCRSCEWDRRGVCSGGCYAQRLRAHLRCSADTSVVLDPVHSDAEILACVPKVVTDVVRTWHRDGKKLMIFLNDEKLLDDENAEFFLEACDGEITVQGLIDRWQDNYADRQQAAEEVIQMARDLFDAGAIRLDLPPLFPPA